MSKETTTDPSVRACGPLFDLLKESCGGSEEGAIMLWERTFWFKFDGKNPVVISDEDEATAAGWVIGATKLMKALIDSGMFEK